MKRLINIIVLSLVLLPIALMAQDDKKKKTETVKIQTSAICEDCKARLEKDIAFEKGVRAVELDEKTKIITITYKTGKNDKESLKKAITKIGYDADEMPADQKAHDKLPDCCQKGATPHK